MNTVAGKPSFTPSAVNKSAKERFVIYHRVSTSRQGISRLGLDAQAEAVAQFLASRPHEVIGSYVEVESGKRSDRPELLKALAECKREKATLIIAKLDRLGRNVAFIANLMDSGVEFICVDNPQATRLMLHMLAAFAEFERELISKRTKDALAMAKAKGVQLGLNGKRLAAKNQADARKRDVQHHPVIAELMREMRSYTKVAERMNAMGIATSSVAAGIVQAYERYAYAHYDKGVSPVYRKRIFAMLLKSLKVPLRTYFCVHFRFRKGSSCPYPQDRPSLLASFSAVSVGRQFFVQSF